MHDVNFLNQLFVQYYTTNSTIHFTRTYCTMYPRWGVDVSFFLFPITIHSCCFSIFGTCWAKTDQFMNPSNIGDEDCLQRLDLNKMHMGRSYIPVITRSKTQWAFLNSRGLGSVCVTNRCPAGGSRDLPTVTFLFFPFVVRIVTKTRIIHKI